MIELDVIETEKFRMNTADHWPNLSLVSPEGCGGGPTEPSLSR